MREIEYSTIVKAIAGLCERAAFELPPDVAAAMAAAAESEQSENARHSLAQCIENAQIASREKVPICQDTGFAVYFVRLGAQVMILGGTLTDAITEGTRQGYRCGFLRKSIVSDPLFDRRNTSDNTPPQIHLEMIGGDSITVDLLPKGGGSENMSALAMLKPSQGKDGVISFVKDTVVSAGADACPPVVVGVGLGGTADMAMLLSKKALLRPVGSSHKDERYAALEKDICGKINSSGVGAQGLGGTVTALGVHIEEYPCHIASLPVAVSLNCHAARRASVTL